MIEETVSLFTAQHRRGDGRELEILGPNRHAGRPQISVVRSQRTGLANNLSKTIGELTGRWVPDPTLTEGFLR